MNAKDIMDMAGERGLQIWVDDLGNPRIKRPASIPKEAVSERLLKSLTACKSQIVALARPEKAYLWQPAPEGHAYYALQYAIWTDKAEDAAWETMWVGPKARPVSDETEILYFFLLSFKNGYYIKILTTTGLGAEEWQTLTVRDTIGFHAAKQYLSRRVDQNPMDLEKWVQNCKPEHFPRAPVAATTSPRKR